MRKENTTRKVKKANAANGTRKVCAKPNPKTGTCSKACEPHPTIAGECIKRCTKTQTRNADGDCVKKPKSGGRRFTYKKRR